MMEGRTMRSVASGTAGVWAVAKASSFSNFVGFFVSNKRQNG